MSRARRSGPLPSLSELSEFEVKRLMVQRLCENGYITRWERARDLREIAREERAARATEQKAKSAARAIRRERAPC